MISRGFIDLLFILLCSTIVMLSESVRLGVFEAAPARVGGGGVAAIDADTVVVVTVGAEELRVADGLVTPEQVAERLGAGRTAVLVPASAQVTHHRVMAAWSALRLAGAAVQLGVEPGPATGRVR
jgi:biopolymer transport protein ExbD